MKNQFSEIPTTNSNGSAFSGIESCELIINNIEGTFLFADKDLRVLLANNRAKIKMREYYGVDFTPGLNLLSLTPLDRQTHQRTLYNEVLGGEERTSVVEKMINDTVLYLEHLFRPARNDQGEILGIIITSKDITERRKAETRLQELEERWRFALEGANQGVWDWNLDNKDVIIYSSSYKKMYGFDEDDIQNKFEEWNSRIHPEDREQVYEDIRRHTDSSDPYYENTYRIKGKDERYRWILAKGMLVKDAQGTPIRMIGTHTDITAQKNAEENYKSLFYNNPLPMWTYHGDTLKILDVNDAAIQHYGYSRDEFLSMSILDIRPEEEKVSYLANVKAGLNANLLRKIWKYKKKSGEVIYVEVSTKKLNAQKEDTILVLAYDVTERVKAQEELIKSNQRFYYAAQAASEALWEWDILTDEVYISEAYKNIFGWQADTLKHFATWENIHPDDIQDTIDHYYSAIHDPQITKWSLEYRSLKADGTYATVSDNAVILRDQDGKAVKIIGAIQDISLQKQAEAALKESNERFYLASKATSDAIYDWDIVNNRLQWGESVQTLFGYSPNEVLVGYWEGLIHPDDRAKTSQSMYQALRDPSQQLWKEEYRFQQADGSYSYVLDRGFIVRDKEGKAIRLIGSMQDITSRKYHECLLSLERSIFELSTDQHTDLQFIVQVLLKGIEELHEDAYTSVILLKEDESIESYSAPRLPEEYCEALRGLKIGPDRGSCGSAMTFKKTVIVEDIDHDPLWKDYKHLAGKFGLKACWSLPIIHSSGKVMGSFAIYYKRVKAPSPNELSTLERIRNILRILMEHHWSLKEIKLANERFDIVMKATHDLIWDMSLETNMITWGKTGLEKVYGVKNEQSICTFDLWLQRIHPEDHERVLNVANQIIQSKQQDTFEVEYRFRKDDGSYSHVYDRSMIIRNAEGKPVRLVGAAQDISERIRLEEELLKNELEHQKAINQATVDSQEQERGEIGKELHDNINQVLTTTKLYLDLALTNPELRNDLIEKSNRNIVSVINEIRQLSRSLMDPSIGDLGLIDSINDLIENINLTRKLHVRLLADRKMEPLLDKKHKLTIFRIIQEALNNAIRHAKATTVMIRMKAEPKKAALIIEDDGIGFHPEQIKKGAGLKNIENRIYLINGTHTIISAPEKGCKIIIEFPINKQRIS